MVSLAKQLWFNQQHLELKQRTIRIKRQTFIFWWLNLGVSFKPPCQSPPESSNIFGTGPRFTFTIHCHCGWDEKPMWTRSQIPCFIILWSFSLFLLPFWAHSPFSRKPTNPLVDSTWRHNFFFEIIHESQGFYVAYFHRWNIHIPTIFGRFGELSSLQYRQPVPMNCHDWQVRSTATTFGANGTCSPIQIGLCWLTRSLFCGLKLLLHEMNAFSCHSIVPPFN